eukprot:maker-scaffold139_size317827-snap-gene-1.25 protein:Tk05016 transcript:maker-scaffold139_size317827-snap-gene-1.25-mRNA-1 annotation:"jnk interacting protein"
MGDREFEELFVANNSFYPRVVPSHLTTSPRNYQLVHAITPLEENKSFLEKVQLGEVLCGIPEEERLYPSFTKHHPTPASTYSQLQQSIETKFQNLPPRHIWSSSEDEEDDIEECDLEAFRKPTIRWSDRCQSLQELKTTKIGGRCRSGSSANGSRFQSSSNNNSRDRKCVFQSSKKEPPPLEDPTSNETFQRSRTHRRQLPETPKHSNGTDNDNINTMSLLDEIRQVSSANNGFEIDNHQEVEPQSRISDGSSRPDYDLIHQSAMQASGNATDNIQPVIKLTTPYPKNATSGRACNSFQNSGEDDGSANVDVEDGPAYDSGNSTSHSPDEQIQRSLMLLNNSFTTNTTLEDTDYDPASLTSPQCDGSDLAPNGSGRRLPQVPPLQFVSPGIRAPLFILPKKLELLDPTHRGLHRFIPRHYDEVEIDIGDPIYVQKEAEDLWCEGANLRTGKIGIFPIAHVVDVEYNDFDPHGTNSERKERYLLEYIGSVESHLYKGNTVLCQAVKKIVGAKVAPKKHACVIEISDKGIKMIDKSRLNLSRHPNQDYFYSLKNVTFCGFHPSNSQYFGFVTKHPRLPKYACHVFVGEGSTQHVAEACGRAFNRFYQKFIETAYPVEDIYLE